MGNRANFRVVADSWKHDDLRNGIDFEIPSTIDSSKKSLLSFMLDVTVNGSVKFSLRINGKKVWTGNFENVWRWSNFQEALEASDLRVGTNTVSFEYESSSNGDFDYSSVRFSDIVIWWRE